MRVLKAIFDFYINSSIHVALGVVSLTCITYLEFNIVYDLNMLFFIGLASITGYNFVKYFGLAKFHHRSLSNALKTIQIFSFVCFLGLFYFGVQLSTSSLIVVLGFAILTFLYAIPLIPNRFFIDEKRKLRTVSGLKIYIIALVWAGVTVVLPLMDHTILWNDDVLLSFLQRFLFVMVLMFPFEIRDLNYDSLKLATIPQKIGVRRTKWVGAVLIIVLVVLEFLKNDINQSHLLTLSIISGITLFFLTYATVQQGKYYSSFWVEGVPILWLLLLMLF